MRYIDRPMSYTSIEALKNCLRLLVGETLINFKLGNGRQRETEKGLKRDISTVIKVARIHSANRNFEEAANLLHNYLIFNPKDCDVILELGNICLLQNEYKKAEKRYAQCININHDYWPAAYELGKLYMALGKYKKAKNMFEKCAKMNKRHIGSRAALAKMIMATDIKKAKYYLNEICKIDSDAQCLPKISKRIHQIESYRRDPKETFEYILEHIKKHEEDDKNKELHGVFSGNSAAILTSAWRNKNNVQPKRCYEVDIYELPFQNAGYMGGSKGTGEKLHFVTIITIANTDFIITAFPSTGNYKPYLRKKVRISATDYGEVA